MTCNAILQGHHHERTLIYCAVLLVQQHCSSVYRVRHCLIRVILQPVHANMQEILHFVGSADQFAVIYTLDLKAPLASYGGKVQRDIEVGKLLSRERKAYSHFKLPAWSEIPKIHPHSHLRFHRRDF